MTTGAADPQTMSFDERLTAVETHVKHIALAVDSLVVKLDKGTATNWPMIGLFLAVAAAAAAQWLSPLMVTTAYHDQRLDRLREEISDHHDSPGHDTALVISEHLRKDVDNLDDRNDYLEKALNERLELISVATKQEMRDLDRTVSERTEAVDRRLGEVVVLTAELGKVSAENTMLREKLKTINENMLHAEPGL